MRIGDVREYVDALRERADLVDEVVEWQLHEYADEIKDLQRDQMLMGRNSEGEEFTPDYLHDPYFKTFMAAVIYANFKAKLAKMHRARIRFPLNYPDNWYKKTPNLIVTGVFQNAIYLTVSADTFTLGSRSTAEDGADAADIEAKYHGKVFGLSPLAVEFWWNYRLGWAIYNYLRRQPVEGRRL